MCAAAVQWEDDLLGLTSKDERDLREYFQDSGVSVGGLKAIDYEKLLGRGSKTGSGSSDHEHISDRQIARAQAATRVERIRDAMASAEAWPVLQDAFSKEAKHYPGVHETLANLLPETAEALAWGAELARDEEVEQAATRAYTSGRIDGLRGFAFTENVLAAIASAEEVGISSWRARDAVIDEMARLAGMLPGRRGRRNAERFEAVQREAEATLARAADAWVRARKTLGVNHREDQRDDGVREDRDALRGLSARVRLMLARPEGN